MKLVFMSDTHFGHDKFHTENWEHKFWKKYYSINQDFILYHLGDLSFIHNHEYLKQIFDKFRKNEHCKNIVLILGNHDDKASRYLKHGVVACDKMIITYKNKEILLSHEPIILSPMLNIHGHLHTKEESYRYYYKLNENNILVESEKIYYIDELIGKDTQLKQLNKISDDWNELKERIEINMDYYGISKFKELVSLNDIEKLEQKYKIGDKND